MTKLIWVAVVTAATGLVSQAHAADLATYPLQSDTERSYRVHQQTTYVREDCELLRIDYRSPYPVHSQLVNICSRDPVDLRPVSELPPINGRS